MAVVDPVCLAVSRPDSSIVLVLVVFVVIGRIPPIRVVVVEATTSPPTSTLYPVVVIGSPAGWPLLSGPA